MEMIKQFKIAFLLLLTLSLLTGLIYPLFITCIGQIFFHQSANGSLIKKNGKTIGSIQIGQYFTSPFYFWSRPSATEDYPYNAIASGGSNLSATNPTFMQIVKARIRLLGQQQTSEQMIPVGLVTASASGLDPDITPAAAFFQIPRIAKIRQLQESELKILVMKFIKNRQFGILGEPRVNVLQLNLALDEQRNLHVTQTP